MTEDERACCGHYEKCRVEKAARLSEKRNGKDAEKTVSYRESLGTDLLLKGILELYEKIRPVKARPEKFHKGLTKPAHSIQTN